MAGGCARRWAGAPAPAPAPAPTRLQLLAALPSCSDPWPQQAAASVQGTVVAAAIVSVDVASGGGTVSIAGIAEVTSWKQNMLECIPEFVCLTLGYFIRITCNVFKCQRRFSAELSGVVLIAVVQCGGRQSCGR